MQKNFNYLSITTSHVSSATGKDHIDLNNLKRIMEPCFQAYHTITRILYPWQQKYIPWWNLMIFLRCFKAQRFYIIYKVGIKNTRILLNLVFLTRILLMIQRNIIIWMPRRLLMLEVLPHPFFLIVNFFHFLLM